MNLRNAWPHLLGALALAAFFAAIIAVNRIDWPEREDPAVVYDRHLKAASAAHVRGDLDAAIIELTSAIVANPEGLEALVTRGVVYQELGWWQDAINDYESAHRFHPDDFAPLNNLAMLLAACPDDSIRDGAEALTYAQQACELTNWENPAAIHTLAVAYAEVGDWQGATDICDEQLGKLNDGPIKEEFETLRELVVAEKPYRLPVPQ